MLKVKVYLVLIKILSINICTIGELYQNNTRYSI